MANLKPNSKGSLPTGVGVKLLNSSQLWAKTEVLTSVSTTAEKKAAEANGGENSCNSSKKKKKCFTGASWLSAAASTADDKLHPYVSASATTWCSPEIHFTQRAVGLQLLVLIGAAIENGALNNSSPNARWRSRHAAEHQWLAVKGFISHSAW